MTVPLLAALASAALGAAVGRWYVVLLPPVAWLVYFTGLRAGWWGSGVGDGWQLALVMMAGLSGAAAAVGVAIAKAVRSRRTAAGPRDEA